MVEQLRLVLATIDPTLGILSRTILHTATLLDAFPFVVGASVEGLSSAPVAVSNDERDNGPSLLSLFAQARCRRHRFRPLEDSYRTGTTNNCGDHDPLADPIGLQALSLRQPATSSNASSLSQVPSRQTLLRCFDRWPRAGRVRCGHPTSASLPELRKYAHVGRQRPVSRHVHVHRRVCMFAGTGM